MGNQPTRINRRAIGRRATAAAAALMLLAAVVVMRPARAAAPAESRTRVSLRLRQVPATEAYAVLGRAAGVRIDFGPLALPAEVRLSAGLIQEPFWTAVLALNGHTGLRVQSVHRQPDRSVRLIPARDATLRSSVD